MCWVGGTYADQLSPPPASRNNSTHLEHLDFAHPADSHAFIRRTRLSLEHLERHLLFLSAFIPPAPGQHHLAERADAQRAFNRIRADHAARQVLLFLALRLGAHRGRKDDGVGVSARRARYPLRLGFLLQLAFARRDGSR
jgi:hypothetical protein